MGYNQNTASQHARLFWQRRFVGRQQATSSSSVPDRKDGTMDKVNLAQKFSLFDEF